jgi:uncharacterized glyoxalase superfamily protein PhnB
LKLLYRLTDSNFVVRPVAGAGGRGRRILRCGCHDQTNQIRQHSGGRPSRALDFYTEKLGFTIITDQPFDEKQRWIELRVPKAETRVVLFTAEGEEKRIGTMMNMSYACDEIEKTYEELKARGVEFEGPPEKQPWGTYAMFKDSEGNRFVLAS